MITANECFKRKCKFYRGVDQPDGTEMTERHYCYAYPDGIPEDINDGTDLHETVRPDQDNEITYVKEDE